jgi:hypothetical protein
MKKTTKILVLNLFVFPSVDINACVSMNKSFDLFPSFSFGFPQIQMPLVFVPC